MMSIPTYMEAKTATEWSDRRSGEKVTMAAEAYASVRIPARPPAVFPTLYHICFSRK